jgi:hypothetical protein
MAQLGKGTWHQYKKGEVNSLFTNLSIDLQGVLLIKSLIDNPF